MQAQAREWFGLEASETGEELSIEEQVIIALLTRARQARQAASEFEIFWTLFPAAQLD